MCLVIGLSSDGNHLLIEQKTPAFGLASFAQHTKSQSDLDGGWGVCCPALVIRCLIIPQPKLHVLRSQRLASLSLPFSFIISFSVLPGGQRTSHLSRLGKQASLPVTKREWWYTQMLPAVGHESHLFTFCFSAATPDAGKGPGGLVAETVTEPFQYKPLRFFFYLLKLF